MRINKYIAQASGLSRRSVDRLIEQGLVSVNGVRAQTGQDIVTTDDVTINGQPLITNAAKSILLNKPTGYVCSRNGQGSKTVYSLLPKRYHNLKPVGRLDKDSSGLLLLTNDGNLAHTLTHPRFAKEKVYRVKLNKPLGAEDSRHIIRGVALTDGLSSLALKGSAKTWEVTMHEGRNRQIRRTFSALNYEVVHLHRVKFGDYQLGNLGAGDYREI